MSKAIKRLKAVFDQQDEEDQEDFNENEGENIVIKGKKDFVKTNLDKLDALQKDLEKYHGKDISYDELKQQQENPEEEIGDDEQEEAYDGEEQEGNDDQIEEKEEERGEFEEDDDAEVRDSNKANQTKESMDKQDEDYLKTLTKFTPNEIKKAKNFENQKNAYDFFIGIRISLQKILNAVNALPFHHTFPKFLDEETSKAYNHSLSSIQKLQQNMLLLHQKILLKSNLPSPNKITSLIRSILSASPIEAASIQQSFHSSIGALMEKITNVWYRKSLVNSFKTSSKMLKILDEDFCKHIKDNISSNYDSIRKKTQKITGETLLGRKRGYQTEEYDKEIYNDLEFYNFLLKEFLVNNEKDLSKGTSDMGNRYDLTMQYILNRNKKNKKNVDTRASKNRKIRYNKHEQLINFMVPQVNYGEMQGRDIIIASLFGSKKRKSKEEEKKTLEIGDDLVII